MQEKLEKGRGRSPKGAETDRRIGAALLQVALSDQARNPSMGMTTLRVAGIVGILPTLGPRVDVPTGKPSVRNSRP